MELTTDISNCIKTLACNALERVGPSDIAYKVLKKSSIRPIDYMRYAEFEAILNQVKIKPNTVVLDVGSPQWFCIYLASQYPETNFKYINILESELEPFSNITQAIGIQNLSYLKEDVRNLSFASGTFDQVISISVIEHIYPPSGGDYTALKEIHRVLKSDGELHLTVPLKNKANIAYVDGDVYEREGNTQTFFAREYDYPSFSKLIEGSNFLQESVSFIVEKPGLLALDYYEWGPGKSLFPMCHTPKLLKLVEKILRYSMDELLAKKYLNVVAKPENRLVNVAALLKPHNLD